jgi:DNA-binding transcriptional LysR family regulator
MTAAKHPWGSLGLDLVTLRVFAATADEGSLAKAAEREVIALSAISRRISTLEARSGVQLFDRRDRGMSLTPAGEMLFHRLRSVFDMLDQVALDLEAVRTGARGVIRLHTHMSAISEGLASELAEFMAQHPGLDVRLEEHTSVDVVHAVSTHTAELGLISGTVDSGDLDLVRWREDRLVALLPKNDPLATSRQLRLEDLVERPFIAMQRDSALLTLCRDQARLTGRTLLERAHATSFESVRKMVAAGLGVSIVPASVAETESDAQFVEARPLAETWARRPLMLCVRSLEHMPAATRLLVQWLTDKADAPDISDAPRAERRAFAFYAANAAPEPQLLAM